MAGYLGTKAVLLSTTAADVIGNAEIGGDLTVGGNITSTGIDDNASSTAITIDASENVGIGTAAPVRDLHISSASAEIMLEDSDGGSDDRRATLKMNGGIFSINSRYDNDTERLSNIFVADIGSGNVGIGTSSPSDKLTVDGSVVSQNAAQGAGNVQLQGYGATSYINHSGTGSLIFRMGTGYSERMRIDSSGNLLVGTTASSSKWGAGQGSDMGLELRPTQFGLVMHMPYECVLLNTDSVTALQRFYYRGSGIGNIATNGTSTQYNTTSDYRLKTDAQPMTGASARVQALNPVNFEWVSTGERVDGFLAHEAQEVVPEAVTGTKDAMRDEEYEVTPAIYEDVVIPAVLDEEGNELEAERTEQRLVSEAVMGTRSVPDYQGIDQSKLVPLLTAALQEALTKIDDMETRLAALEGN